jgi:arginyl-tRNA synthetase
MIQDKIIRALEKTTGQKNIHLETPVEESHGDFSTNIAMAADLNAESVVEKLSKDSDLKGIISKIEVAKPKFINFWLSDKTLVNNLGEVLQKKDEYGSNSIGHGQTVVIDYSSPNIAKRFGIGHLRSTVIGQALYNLYQFLGYKVIGDNHLGDWGTQFGTLLYQITNQNITLDSLNIDKLEELYVDFNKKAVDQPELWDEARAWFKKLEEGDKQAKEIWQATVDISLKEFERVYKLLGVKIDFAYGESFYEDKMTEVLQILREKGISQKSQGAEIVELRDLPPAMVIKSDGATTYLTRDLAAINFRIKKWNPQIIIYEVGADQTLYFKQLFKIADKLGWTKDRELVHIAHGLIRFKEGKMSTRKGRTVKLEEVLEEAIKKAGQFNKEVAQTVGVGAVKYFDLMHNPQSDIVFDWEKIFVLEGNSGPYLQYTVARTNSVLVKAQKSKFQTLKNESLELNREELALLRTFAQFEGVIINAAKTYSPNLICNYLFDLAQKYNTFYNQHQILGNENESLRLALTQGTNQILKNGLSLLGIETPEKM